MAVALLVFNMYAMPTVALGVTSQHRVLLYEVTHWELIRTLNKEHSRMECRRQEMLCTLAVLVSREGSFTLRISGNTVVGPSGTGGRDVQKLRDS
jgi:hypothetical protein